MPENRLPQIRHDAQARGDELTITNSVFVADLRRRGYSAWTSQAYGKVVENCQDWLRARRVKRQAIREDCLSRFVRAYAAKGRRRGWRRYRLGVCRRALRQWLGFLRERGMIPRLASARPRGQEALIEAYDRHLASVRGLALGTRLNQQHQARRFLRWLSRVRGGMPLRRLGPTEVMAYVASCARALPPATARNLASGLRCFLRFLAWRRLIRPLLDRVVPPLAPWPRTDLPRGLTDIEYRRFLISFDRRTALGCRDYALALCLGDLGLRAGEAAALQLGDLDWHHGLLCLPKTKQGRERQLPMPARVARALGHYLQRSRPRSDCRAIFVRHRPPLDQGLSPSQVGWIMSRAFVRSQLSARGAHALRYGLATRLQRRGVGLKAIADLLGHQSLESTVRYARVDFEALRQVALPWPEARR